MSLSDILSHSIGYYTIFEMKNKLKAGLAFLNTNPAKYLDIT